MTVLQDTNKKLFQTDQVFQGNMPVCIRFSLTNECNAACVMCQTSQLPNALSKEVAQGFLDLSLYQRIAEELFPFAELVSFEIMGEPTLHPQFPEFLRIARAYNCLTEVWTNGSTIHKTTIQEAICKYVDKVVLSIDSFDVNVYTKIRRGLDAHHVLHNLKQLHSLRSSGKTNSTFQLAINVTLMTSNIDTFPAMVRDAPDYGIDEMYADYVGFYNKQDQPESLFNHPRHCDHILQLAKQESEKNNIRLHLPPEISRNIPKSNDTDFHCCWINNTIIILSNGDVIPCCHAYAPFQFKMGNAHDQSIQDIWYGKDYSSLRRSIENKRFAPLCLDCVMGDRNMSFQENFSLNQLCEFVPDFIQKEWNRYQQYQENIVQEQLTLYKAIEEYETKYRALLHEINLLEKRLKKSKPIISRLNKHIFCFDRFRNAIGTTIDNFHFALKGQNKKTYKRKINQLLYESGESFQGNYPCKIELSIIHDCNINCIMCNYSHLSKEEKSQTAERFLTVDQYEHIAKSLFPTATSLFLGIGGEPTLHPDLPQFLRIAHDYGIEITLTTNGLLLHCPSIAQTIVETVRTLYISIDGSSKQTYQKIRKGAKWDHLMQNIQFINSLRKNSSKSKLKLAANFTLMKDTIDEFPAFVELASTLQIDAITAEHLIVTNEALQAQSLFYDKKRTDENIVKAIQRAETLNIEIAVPDLFDMEQTVMQIKSGTVRNIRPQVKAPESPYCTTVNYSVVITPTGDVIPCSHPDAMYQLILGNIFEEDFDSIWFGRTYNQLRYSDTDIPSICSNCSMSGRSDGDIPIFHGTQFDKDRAISNNGCFYPPSFISKRLKYISHIVEENSKLNEHLQNCQHIHNEMAKHKRNIQKILKKNNSLYSSKIAWKIIPNRILQKGIHFNLELQIENTGIETWYPGTTEQKNSVMIGGFVFCKDQKYPLEGWVDIITPWYPNESREITISTNVDSIPHGMIELHISPIKIGIAPFTAFGDEPLVLPCKIIADRATNNDWYNAQNCCTNLWTPTQGFYRDDNTTFPLFATNAQGATLTDQDGTEYIDYIMGWGTSTLGYSNSIINKAVQDQISCGPTLSIPHKLQYDVADQLCNFLPFVERVLFSKNGSDAVEAAIRIARALTGKNHILCCGYHGFHDWFASTIQSITGIPESHKSLVHLFPYGDVGALNTQFSKYEQQVAAVVIEPASLHYPPKGYLESVRNVCKANDTLLIFDEIMSAFRLANGGAVEIYDVIPDMVCVGKGIANGFPLAALGGPHSIMDTAFQIGYGPTYQGETISLAAANAALKIYQQEPVCEYVNKIGNQLITAIKNISTKYNVPIVIEGIAPRFVVRFEESHGYREDEIRTYFIQELLREKIMFGGTFLLSYAHTSDDIQKTVSAFERIFHDLHNHVHQNQLLQHINIPLHQLYYDEHL